ncbi:MAG: hypothetical protein H0V82_10995 [Candidatus Protochlamydia sp.]|nr:hypothetical protein [Candidatus Protochlamydia sp.]
MGRTTNLSIVEAVETLSNIVDLDLDHEFGITQKHELLLQSDKIDYKTVHWLDQKDAGATVNLVRETYRIILHYLKQFYRREYGYVTDQKTIEGIKTIMVLVGEAAKKLDKYTNLFHQAQKKSVTEFKEYQQLQEFYLTKIAHKVDEKVLSKWILGLSLGKWKAQKEIEFKAAPSTSENLEEAMHIFIDLDTVKKDTEYELFFIRKEDGSRFFNPRLLRNIKLVCDFGIYFGEHKGTDPLEAVKQWHDKMLYICARDMLKGLGDKVEHFFHDIRKLKNQELINILNKALIALLMSSHSQNLMKHNPIKSCAEYFSDFQIFLREALHSHTYQKWLAYPPKETNQLAYDLLDFIHLLNRTLYAGLQGIEELLPVIHKLIKEAHVGTKEPVEISQKIAKRLADDNGSMTKLMRRHSSGPLLKVLNILEEDAFHVFDPLLQRNIPSQLFHLNLAGNRLIHLRMASPIYQEFINKAIVVEEFKAFIRSYSESPVPKTHLLVNLQDRTSWREHARSAAIEELQYQPGMENALTVVTLAFDTDFYHQLNPYHQLNHADAFMAQFKEHLLSDNSGFYFPNRIALENLSSFIDQTFPLVHQIFFSEKNVLQRENRLDFIEIFYLLLELKLIEWIKPASFSFTCKDGIDVGPCNSAALLAFLKIIGKEEFNDEDWDRLNLILYGPALLIRERLIIPERFNRLTSAIRTIEAASEERGNEPFFQSFKKLMVI